MVSEFCSEFWTKQHLAKLRQRSKEVADDLETEASFAEKLFRQSEKDAARNKERTRQEISRYLVSIQLLLSSSYFQLLNYYLLFRICFRVTDSWRKNDNNKQTLSSSKTILVNRYLLYNWI
jgi:5-methylcytosine-specific restriction endonuclease McrBC GTP-binding regulatory subunit McrB